MNGKKNGSPHNRLREALRQQDASGRLQAALTAGTNPDASYVAVLVERCGEEPDFFVRDMLTWALTRHDRETTMEHLLPQLASPSARARSQALHTLSKIGDARAWSAITDALLQDGEPEVARAAWRTAAGLVPPDQETDLARLLATQLGRGDAETQRSLSRVFAVLGQAAEQIVDEATTNSDAAVSAHAMATLTIIADPEAGFEAVMTEAKRVIALRAAPVVTE